jgi:hypothetical protein
LAPAPDVPYCLPHDARLCSRRPGRQPDDAAHRVVTTPQLAPFAAVLLDLDVNGGRDVVDWSWIATAAMPGAGPDTSEEVCYPT